MDKYSCVPINFIYKDKPGARTHWPSFTRGQVRCILSFHRRLFHSISSVLLSHSGLWFSGSLTGKAWEVGGDEQLWG